MVKKVTKIENVPKIPKRKKVAAYARVSSGKEAMLSSLSSQVKYYKDKIQNNPEWKFAGVYADEATTGTKDDRDEFQLLLKDSRLGKIDLIITKSISRFARNSLVLLKTIRELKELNVNVFFEEQNIYTISEEGEMILTILSTFFQEESRSTSDNMKWRIQKDFEKGIIWGGNSCLGYKLKNKKFYVVEDEANTVKLIYSLYLEGYGDEHICDILDEKGIRPYKAKKWNRTSVIKILTNYNYTGDLVLQKTYRENHLTKAQKINKGEHNKYIVSKSHEPIISKEIFYEAQKIRKLKTADHIKSTDKDKDFKGYIKCGICGKAYTYKKTPYNIYYMCTTARTKGKNECPSNQVPNDKLKEAVSNVLKQDEYNKDKIKELIEKIIVLPENKLLIELKDGTTKEYKWEYESRSKSWTEEMKEQARIKALNRKKGDK